MVRMQGANWGRCQWWGRLFFTDDQSHSDRARPKAVLGVGVGGGHPLPHGGSRDVTPENFYDSTLL